MDTTPSHPDNNPDLSFEQTLRGLKAGQKVFANRYTLLRILGRGGMGVVWLARDEELGHDVALKFLPEFVALDRAAIGELKEETKKTLDLTHPHIVRTYTFLTDAEAELAAIAMEHVDGLNLSDLRMDQEARVFEATDAQFQKWIGQLCGALAYAHARKRIVHRDLKPSNVMVNEEGDLKVTDFGIARSLTESRTRLSRGPSASGGTLPYMSPQQALGERATESDDIYSLGATLYELLTGKPPFFSGEIFEQIKTKTPPPITERRVELNVQSAQPVPDAWERAVLNCLAKRPEDRPRSVAALARLLSLEGEFPEPAATVARKPTAGKSAPKSKPAPVRGGHSWLVPAALVVVLLGGAGAWWFGMEKPKRDLAAALVKEARAAQEKDDVATAEQKIAAALALVPTQAGAIQLRNQIEHDRSATLERIIGRADAAMARKDLLEAREAFKEALTVQPDHPRAKSGYEGLKDVMGGIEVRTSPAGAVVQVAGLKEAVAPSSIGQLPLGKYPVTLKLEGYDPVTEEITLRNDSFVPLDQKLVRQRGALKLQTTPPGMTYSVKMTKSVIGSEDEQKFTKEGKTPSTLENLPTGDYEVKLTRPGWPDQVQTLPIKSASSESITHEFAEGALSLESTPAGQEAALSNPDGSVFAQGKTPLLIKAIPSGAGYKATLKRTGWPDFEKTGIAIAKGDNPAITHDFAQGSVTLTTLPVEADAELLSPDGKSLGAGKTPLVVKDLPTGPGYTAVIKRQGWPEARLPVIVTKSDAALPVVISHEFTEGSVRIESTPPGCKFTLSVPNSELDVLKKELADKEVRYATKGLSKSENASLKARIAELQSQISNSKSQISPHAGATPMDVTGLPTGMWKLVMMREGWPDFEKDVGIAKGTNAPVVNEFGEGTVKLTSDPPGCEVYLGKRLLGKTPCEAKVPTGKVGMDFRHPVLGSQLEYVSVEKAMVASCAANFQYGYVNVSANSKGAKLRLGKMDLGVVPCRLMLPTGDHSLEVISSDILYEGTQTKVHVENKKDTTVMIHLEIGGLWTLLKKLEGNLRAQSKPEIWNSSSTGQISLKVDLEARRVNYEISSQAVAHHTEGTYSSKMVGSGSLRFDQVLLGTKGERFYVLDDPQLLSVIVGGKRVTSKGGWTLGIYKDGIEIYPKQGIGGVDFPEGALPINGPMGIVMFGRVFLK